MFDAVKQRKTLYDKLHCVFGVSAMDFDFFILSLF